MKLGQRFKSSNTNAVLVESQRASSIDSIMSLTRWLWLDNVLGQRYPKFDISQDRRRSSAALWQTPRLKAGEQEGSVGREGSTDYEVSVGWQPGAPSPMVGLLLVWNSFRQKRDRQLVLPTPLSPMSTTCVQPKRHPP